SRITDAFGAEVTLDALFAHPTVEALALHLPALRPLTADGDGEDEGDACPQRLLAVLDDLPEDELDRLLGLQPRSASAE
ncbi:MAG: hypothetical protein JO306_17235, partial [Gemmatimonadetes bacterium]|nr:hypothetical protein [Gemmatimonadota bacterium]